MKKYIILLIIPFLSFGQIEKNDISTKDRWNDLHNLIWVGNGEFKIPKLYKEDDINELIERFNDENLESRIDEDFWESDDKKHWVLQKYKEIDDEQKRLKELLKKYRNGTINPVEQNELDKIEAKFGIDIFSDVEEEEEEEEILDFAIVESIPIFPGCWEPEPEILKQVKDLTFFMDEVIYLNKYLFSEENKKNITKIQTKNLNRKAKKFIKNVEKEYIEKIISTINSKDLIDSDFKTYIIDNLNAYKIIISGDNYLIELSQYIESNIDTLLINSKINSQSSEERAEILQCFNTGIMKHILEEYKYPKIAKEMGVSEKVYVQFMIDKTGYVKDAKVVRGENKYLKEEAIRLVNSLPKMIPASQRKKPVGVTYTIPINFQLQ